MASAGPWFAVLGFIFTDCVIVQRLTDYIWVGIDSALSRSHVNRVARMFYALRTNIDRLNTYYKQLVIDTPKPGCSPYAPMRYFPSITSYYDDVQHKLVHFHYTGYLENGFDCVTLRANTSTEEQIVVKFVETYSDRAHRLLAGQRLAPKLHYFGSLQFDSKQPTYPKLSMVVMDYVDGKTFALAKPSMDKHATVKVKQEIIRALDLLHGNGLVFGDLRPPNVMVTKDGKGMLIDFDWAGVAGQVLYPHRLSPAVTWPEGVESLDPIETSHDWDMLEKLFL
jgi:serine/threonine protein kinase